MTDIQIEFDALRTARVRVDDALSTFESAGTVGGDLAGLTGEDRLAGKVRDFADNWDYNRGKLIEKLQFVRDGIDAIVDTMTEVDAELARQAEEAAPDTDSDSDSDGEP
ncbi:hypothetical protein ITJ43_11445 [Microbacterium sp. VKM Ac-2870]|uniref:hypothetical protein n=1 Tax=Microbacterium sp. VKM Ac-2870 TaxID=2783825 RepID=UPI00188A515B|nr:hypothetical protein [Microbacterium sp. VKM Ac-2870]MBF4562754.1 hypothetical protein [Microbacterium sp. VKM Ac-2870]